MLLLLVLVVLFVFRWRILEPIIGTVRMCLFDAIMFTFFAATNIAQPGPVPWVGYLCGSMCVFFAISAARKYLLFDRYLRNPDELSKSTDDDASE